MHSDTESYSHVKLLFLTHVNLTEPQILTVMAIFKHNKVWRRTRFSQLVDVIVFVDAHPKVING